MTGHAYQKMNVLLEDYRHETDFAGTGDNLLLSAEQQQELIKLVREGNAAAKQKMISHNMQLVLDIVKRYVNSGVAPLDLVREGNLGLIHALEKLELEDGFRFSTYAASCIRQNIERAVMKRNSSPYLRASRPPVTPYAVPSQTPSQS
jgi:DNA-directed RNA polymerase sigma subunit (sigma70/sigma32)